MIGRGNFQTRNRRLPRTLGRFVAAAAVIAAGSVAAITDRQDAPPAPPVFDGIEAPGSDASPLGCEPMTNARLDRLLRELDPELSGGPGNWVIRFQDTPAQVITDERADRMRIMIPVDDAADVEQPVLYRMLQANFESALDVRYAIAQGMVWVVFIHPLSPLSPVELSLALAQTYNAAATYGDTYSGGLFQFGGGDHRDDVFDEIINKGTPL